MKTGGGEYVHRRYGVMDDTITMIITTRRNPLIKELNLIEYDGQQYEIVRALVDYIDVTALVRRYR